MLQEQVHLLGLRRQSNFTVAIGGLYSNLRVRESTDEVLDLLLTQLWPEYPQHTESHDGRIHELLALVSKFTLLFFLALFCGLFLVL